MTHFEINSPYKNKHYTTHCLEFRPRNPMDDHLLFDISMYIYPYIPKMFISGVDITGKSKLLMLPLTL